MLKKPSARFPKALQGWLGSKKIEEVECVISDIAGVVRGKAMPLSKFDRLENVYMPSSIFYQTISGDYVDLPIPNQWTENDMVLTPDISTAICSPWADDVTVQVICDVLDLDGNPIEIVPRNVLKRIINLYKQKGWDPIVAPEIEFYLTKPNLDPSLPIEPMLGRTGRKVASRQAYSMAAVDEYGRVIDDIYDFAEAQGFEIDTINQEGGAGQIEINLVHGDPLKLADQIFFFKRMIREAAFKRECFATFMAKPMQEEPGSAMHIHQSIYDKKNKNIFFNKKSGLSKKMKNYIGGLQEYTPLLMPIYAPNINSFRRLFATWGTPKNVKWGIGNRSCGFRIPSIEEKNMRIENRIPGSDTNPYLVFAANLASGYLGMKNNIQPTTETKDSAFQDKFSNLPKTIDESLSLFENNEEINTIFNDKFIRSIAAIRRVEYQAYLSVISSWEREYLLLNV